MRSSRAFRLPAVFAITLMVAACGDIAFNGSDAGNVEAGADAADTDSASPSDAAIDRAMVVADAATPLRRVFVTSSTFAASQMSSASPVFETADGLCAQASSKLVNPGTFRSWISDGTTSAANRDIFHPPYYDVTRSVLVFAADAKFSSAGLLSEQNEPPPASWWTGMTTTTTIGETCNDWKGDASYASVGRPSAWYGSTAVEDSPCMGGFAAVICFEQ